MINKNAQCYYESALKLLLPAIFSPEIDGFKFKLGKKHYYFCGTSTPLNNSSSLFVARNKFCANKTLESAGFPVPKAVVIDYEDYVEENLPNLILGLTFPLVAKPQAGKLGQDVLCNIQTIEILQNYLAKNKTKYEYIIIEEFHGNLNAYRVLVYKNRIIDVIQRDPAEVVGDGIHNVEELIQLTNQARQRLSDTLGSVVADEECHFRLKELGIGLDTIPSQNEVISLAYTCNASRGGTYKSLGKHLIAKANKRLFIQAARELNLDLVGFDVQCTDIAIPIAHSKGVIIEANDGPSVRIHEYPLEGKAVWVSKKILRNIIYRHPLAYLNVLYQHQRSGPYFRILLVMIFMGCIYQWI